MIQKQEPNRRKNVLFASPLSFFPRFFLLIRLKHAIKTNCTIVNWAKQIYAIIRNFIRIAQIVLCRRKTTERKRTPTLRYRIFRNRDQFWYLHLTLKHSLILLLMLVRKYNRSSISKQPQKNMLFVCVFEYFPVSF